MLIHRIRPALLGGALVLAAAPALAADASPQAAASITQRLTASGYTNVHDVEWDDGVWEADATSPAGQEVDLTLSPDDGRILSETLDD
jgi:hypothetical protein